MRFLRFIGFLAYMLVGPAYAWNALGHELVAQIAYDNMHPQAKALSKLYNRALDAVYPVSDFLQASIWLDTVRHKDAIPWFTALHFVDWQFSLDGRKVLPYAPVNAIWAIDNARQVLISPYASAFDKGIALRILIHVIGDIHQPLHVTSLVSKRYPQGDKGGNGFPIKAYPLATNLHRYWDVGGGLLGKKGKQNPRVIKKWAHEIEKKWPCRSASSDSSVRHWAAESHHLGITVAYAIKPYTKPTKAYQLQTKKLAIQQIALAGCRLAAVLNNLPSKN